jgi:hypothetical protein
MANQEFDCVVFGDEPAGLWLLQSLARESVVPLKLGWIRGRSSRPVALPTTVARAFGIPTGETWSPELVFPEDSLSWTAASLRARYPDVPLVDLWDAALPSSRAHLNTARAALFRYPELVGQAAGIWKWAGKSWALSPEMMLIGSLQYLETSFWEPMCHVPHEIDRWAVEADVPVIESIKPLRAGSIAVQLKEADPFFTKVFIFNSPLCDLKVSLSQLPHKEWPFDVPALPRVSQRLYRLRLQVENGVVPRGTPPICLFFDSDEIPDKDCEMSPVEFTRHENATQIDSWISAPQECSLELLMDRFRQGVRRLNRQMPFLPMSTIHIEAPLGLETCHDEERRQLALSSLEASAIEIYDTTMLHARTPRRGIFDLGPHICSHLLFPLGPLSEAREIRDAILRKQKAPKSKISPKSSIHETSAQA